MSSAEAIGRESSRGYNMEIRPRYLGEARRRGAFLVIAARQFEIVIWLSIS